VPPRKIRDTREMLAAIVTALETGRE
jgi:hypothetical protein